MATHNQINLGLSGSTGTGFFVGSTSPTIATPVINQINDSNGNPILVFNTVANAVNYISITNAATGVAPLIQATGTDGTVIMGLQAKGAVFSLSAITVAGNATLQFVNSAGTQYIALAAPTTIASSKVFVLPSADGAANSAIITDGSLNLSFGKPSGSYISTQYLTTTGTYTPTSGTNTIKIKGIGGGGGGSGTGTSGSSGGGNGGDTTFNSTTLVGKGGTGAPNNAGGAGGVTGTGSLTLPGSDGHNGEGLNANVITGGNGGAGIFGQGGGRGGSSGAAGTAGGINTGGGGGGGGGGATVNSGGGGGSGSYSEVKLTGVTGTYSYTIGAAGSAGGAGTSGFAGGLGSKGLLIVEEYA